ncbi:MAG TPA: 23S rRNA (adenine(2030)-N(6))-methyltransferase RlmJ [Streptosporangiaceae bacterium]
MANPHFANLGDVWKHLLLTEAISWLQPGHYIETHAGSASYAVTDDLERGLGAQMFLSASSEVEPLRSSPYRRHILELARGAAPSYPGSPLLAMMLLGRACRYVFCDTDPSSVADLRAARERLGLQKEVQVIHGDGLAETTALLQAHAIGAASLVHVDPFDFGAAGPAAISALQLVTRLAAASIPAFAWYGLTSRSAPHELFHDVTTTAPAARAWCAELRVGGQRANAAGIGSGCGVLFTAGDLAPVESMRRAADAYVRAFNEHSVAADARVHVTASFALTASDTS